MTTENVFASILDGDIPSHKIYEDKHTYAFLDIAPLALGHTLVIHKHDRAENFSDMSSQAAAQLTHAIQEVIKLLKTNYDADGVNLLLAEGSTAGQEVPHAHMHVVPRFADDELEIHKANAKRVPGMALEEVASKITGD